MSSQHPQGAAPERAAEMVPHPSVRPSISAELEQGESLPGATTTPRDGEAGGARQRPVPSMGTSRGLCRRLQDCAGVLPTPAPSWG